MTSAPIHAFLEFILPIFFPSHWLSHIRQRFNPLTDDKILDQTKLKAFADDKLNVTKMIIFVFDRVENIVGKVEIAHYEQFLLFPQWFQKASFPEASKGVIVWEWVKHSFDISPKAMPPVGIISWLRGNIF